MESKEEILKRNVEPYLSCCVEMTAMQKHLEWLKGRMLKFEENYYKETFNK